MVTTSGPIFIPTFPHTGLNSSTKYVAKETRIWTPVRLKIPSIKVNAVVERIGLTTTKEIDVPKGHGHVGWYKLGPKPGEQGSAVIYGHFARKTSGWAVFNDLYKLRTGDKLLDQRSTQENWYHDLPTTGGTTRRCCSVGALRKSKSHPSGAWVTER